MLQGILSVGGIFLEPHEVATVNFLVACGKQVELLVPSRQKGIKTPDILLDGQEWEIKSPKGIGKYTIQHAFKAGAKQADYIIFDIRRMRKKPEENIIAKIQKELDVSKTVKRVLVITKTEKIIDLHG
jgi:hypothetical protein